MQWQLSPSVIAEAGTALGILILTVCFPWRDISRRAHLIGSVLLTIAALWILTHSIEIGTPVASYKAYLMGLQLIWGLLALTLWLMYIIYYTATGKWQTVRIYTLFGIIPLLAILAVATNHIYGLMWTDPGLNINNPYLPLEPAYGLAYWVFMAYMGALIASGSFLIFKKVIRQHNFRGWEPWTLILAVVIPLLVAFLEVTGVTQSANLPIGLTPFFSGIGSIVLVWSLPRFHLQKVIPIARNTVFDQISDGVVVLNMQNRVVDLNPAAEHLAGYTSSEALGLPVEQIWTNWPSQLDTVFEELTLAHAGEQRTYSLHPHTITDHKNRSLNKVVLLIDISERKRGEEALRDSEERFRLIAENSPDYIVQTDMQGNVLYSSPAIERMSGHSPKEIAGRNFTDILPPTSLSVARTVFKKVAEGETVVNVKVDLLNRNGSSVPVEVSVAPIIKNKEVVGFLGIARDITERKQAEEELKQSNTALYKVMHDTIQAMAVTCEMRDPYTAGHQQRVAQLAVVIAEGLHLSDNEREGLRVAALVHDIGKMSIPAEILSKPGKLTTNEFDLVKNHVQASYDILKGINFPWPVARTVLQHHERMDGSGYPGKLPGKDIILEARIIAVADVVEAMASHRPYRPALGIDQALAEIAQKKGILYDSDVVDACLKVFADKAFKFL